MPAATKKAAPKKAKKATFSSPFLDLTMVRIAPDTIYDTRGNSRVEAEHPIELEDGSMDESPWTIQFENGEFVTDDARLIAHIKDSPLFNVSIWEAGNAPDEPKPTLNEQMEIVLDAIGARDEDALKKLIKSEKAKHNRQPVLHAAESALERIAQPSAEFGGSNDETATTAATPVNADTDAVKD